MKGRSLWGVLLLLLLSRFSRVRLCNPIAGSPPGSPVPGILQARTLKWITFSQFSSVAQSCPTLCDPMDCSTPGFPVHHQVLEPTQTHVVYLENSQTLLIPAAGALNGGLTAQVVFQRGTGRWKTGGQSACPKTGCPC